MKATRAIAAVSAIALGLTAASTAQACSDPSEQWYRDVSDVVFDGTARCDLEERTCMFRVSRVVLNPARLGVERRTIEVDFQNFYADWHADNPDTIILACGVRYFEPEQERFRARFYANLDEETSELIIRRALINGASNQEDEG